MFLFFAGVVWWAFRPGSRSAHEESASIPFRHEDKPAAPRDAATEETPR
jgi:cytochrome c oxidase cbb3-type subunit 4